VSAKNAKTFRKSRASRDTKVTLSDACGVLEKLAPVCLAQDWDNVGLLAGDRSSFVSRAMLCIDLTPDVADEAIKRDVNLIVAYHPPIFKPINRLVWPGHDTSATVFRCLRKGIAIYSTHTALDAADGGTNDCVAEMCGIVQSEPIEYAETKEAMCKVVVFVPADCVDAVADAMHEAGAGRIGEYERCSFRIPGVGTFRGSDTTTPAIGETGQYETVGEIRLESLTPRRAVPEVVQAIRNTHSYEEPAVDVYPLAGEPVRGIGRVGTLAKPVALAVLARRLKKAARARFTQFVGEPETMVSRAIICVGAAGSLPFGMSLSREDVVITGEMRHHDALTVSRRGCSAIVLGHWSSERPVLESFAERMHERLPGVTVMISEDDIEPFNPV
jgi:dinuclear metal center YbgI/SA1388 family protein